MSSNVTEHLANERTMLAWMRTSIGLMGFGFIIVKFSLFTRQITMIMGKDAIMTAKVILRLSESLLSLLVGL